jgi:hypothetical protein
MGFTSTGGGRRVAAMALAPAMALLAAGLITSPGNALADSGNAKLTISAPARATTGSTVTIRGTLTEGSAPVAGSPVTVTAYDTLTGADTTRQPTTNAAGDWFTTVKVTGDLQITAYDSDAASNQVSALVTAVATATLRLATSVPRPWLLDLARVTAAPAGFSTPVLQVRAAGSTVWRTAPDTSGVWGTRAGTIYVRAVVSAEAGAFAQGTSSVVKVTVGKGKVPSWLTELNAYRALNDAPPVAENAVFSHGDWLHIRYMEKTGDFSHVENSKSKWYTPLGAEAGESSDLAFGDPNPVAGWAAAPYHALSELSKYNTLAGYSTDGFYAALWTIGSSTSLLNPSQPLYQFPANGKTTGLLSYSGGEIPDPLSGCPKAWQNAWNVGLPIIFGNQRTVAKPSATVTSGRTSLKVCVVGAGIYGDAVFAIPLLPLNAHHTYAVTVRYDGKVQSRWSFRTS